MADDSPDRDPEIRKRAAWLLGMLALVAALLVTLMVTFFNTSGGGEGDDIAGPTDVPVTGPASVPPTSDGQDSSPTGDTASDTRSETGSDSPSTGSTGATGTSSGTDAPAPGGRLACPSTEACALDSDIGNGVAAINAYRTENGRDAVPGTVSDAAKKCALSNGSDCSGGWAESPVPIKDGRADGPAAVAKVKQLGKLLGDMKSIEVGWAYDPGSKQLYFAIVRNG